MLLSIAHVHTLQTPLQCVHCTAKSRAIVTVYCVHLFVLCVQLCFLRTGCAHASPAIIIFFVTGVKSRTSGKYVRMGSLDCAQVSLFEFVWLLLSSVVIYCVCLCVCVCVCVRACVCVCV